jgi:hypothetical protein
VKNKSKALASLRDVGFIPYLLLYSGAQFKVVFNFNIQKHLGESTLKIQRTSSFNTTIFINALLNVLKLYHADHSSRVV